MFSNADMVFRNEILVKTILNNLDIGKEIFKHLNLRLVSKECNTEMLKFIGKDCQHIEFDLTFDWDLYETVTRINGQLIPKNGVEQCIQFLRNVVNVDIKSVHFLGDSDFSNTEKLHEFFMETLVLTNEIPVRILTADQVEICSSNEKSTICLPCRMAASVCKEYGPMTMDVLLHSFETPLYFTTLKITDFLLQLIAIKCTKESKTREECVEMLKGMITPNISCDNLFIPIFVMDWNMGNIPHAQPREVFTEIFQK